MLQGVKCYSLSMFSPPPMPPRHICVKKKINLYKQNITTDKASLCIKPLKHFIAPSGRARAAWCSSLTCHTHTYSPRPRNSIQVMPGRAGGNHQRCLYKRDSGLQTIRQPWLKSLHTIWGVTYLYLPIRCQQSGPAGTSPPKMWVRQVGPLRWGAQLGACRSWNHYAGIP